MVVYSGSNTDCKSSEPLKTIVMLCYVMLSESPLIIYPIQFRCLVLIIVNKDLSSSTSFNTSSFDTCSVQLIVPITRHIHISKASNLVMSFFLRVHVSAHYKATLQISVFTILFLRHLSNPPLSNTFLLEKASFPIAILLFISLFHLLSFFLITIISYL